MNAIELFDDIANGKWCQVSQSIIPGLRSYDQEVFFEGLCNMVNVLGATLLNILPLFTFLVMAETILSRSRSMLKSCLARRMMSATWRGCCDERSMSCMKLIWDLPLPRGLNFGSSPFFRNSRITFSWDLSSYSWILAHSLISIASPFIKKWCMAYSCGYVNNTVNYFMKNQLFFLWRLLRGR